MDTRQFRFRPKEHTAARRSESSDRPARRSAPRVEGLEGRELLSGVISDIATIAPVTASSPMVVASDGNLWFTESNGGGGSQLGKVTISGSRSDIAVPNETAGGTISSLAADNAGNVWFTYDPPAGATVDASTGSKVGKVSSSGSVTEYNVPALSNRAASVAVGPDGQVWAAINSSDPSATPVIAKVGSDGSLTTFPVTGASQVSWLTVASDGNLWFVAGQKIGKATPVGVVTLYSLPTPSDGSAIDLTNAQLTPLAGGNVWFLGLGGISNIDNTGKVTTITSPSTPINSLGTASDGLIWFSFLPPSTSSLASVPGAVLAQMAPGGSPNTLTDRADGSGVPVVRLVAGHDSGLWLAESNGTVARINLTSLQTYSPPIITPTTSASLTAVQGQAFSGAVVTFKPNTLASTLPNYTASIDWGNGQVTKGTVVMNSDGSLSVNGTTTYTSGAGSTVKVTVTIGDGSGHYAQIFNAVAIQAPAATTSTSTGRGITSAVAYIRGPHGRQIAVSKAGSLRPAVQARLAIRASHPQGPAQRATRATRVKRK